MIQQQRMPRRFGVHASLIQLLALFLVGGSADGGTTQSAGTLASLLFWACSISILMRHRDRASGIDLFFLRWGLLPFVLIGTPLLRPLIAWWEWPAVVLLPGEALLLVASLMYLITRIFGLRSPFDELGLDSAIDSKPPDV